MVITNILVGALIGVAMSVPVGPSGVIGIRRILSRGVKAGLSSGLGVALGDMIFAVLVVSGIASVSSFLSDNATAIQIGGAFIVVMVGILGLRRGPKLTVVSQGNRKLAAFRDVTSMLFITLANPQTIIGFSTSFAATAALYSVSTSAHIGALIGGVFAGSFIMWAFLSVFVSRWRVELEDENIIKIHRYASLLIIFIGFSLLLYALLLGEPIKFI